MKPSRDPDSPKYKDDPAYRWYSGSWRTESGIAAVRRYDTSSKGLARRNRYNSSSKYVLAQTRYMERQLNG